MRRERLHRAAALALVPLFLLAGWVYLWTNSHTVDTEAQGRALALAKDLKQLDSEWSADVLRSHADLDPNYDALVAPLQRFDAGLAQLRARAATLHQPDLDDAVTGLAEAIDAKAGLIDAFKAQNSLFKNSLRYVPTAYRDLQERLVGNHWALARIDGRLGFLVNESMRYSAVPDGEATGPLRSGIAALRDPSSRLPATQGDRVGNLLSHLDTLLRLRSQQAELLRAISQVPVAVRVDALAAAFSRRDNAELAGQFRAQRLLLAYSAFALFLVCTGTGFIAYRNATERGRLRSLVDEKTRELNDLATRDELTRVHNRRHMNELVRPLVDQHARSGAPLCIALLDIDWFKSINDRFGHAAGDSVLLRFANITRETLRETDLLGRWGGEEFLVALPDTSLDQAAQALSRVRESLALADFSTLPGATADPGPALRVTFSAGLVLAADGESVAEAIERADQAMYRAKTAGRDRIETAFGRPFATDVLAGFR